MSYICPTCGKQFETDIEVSQHFLKCWKENNPHHKSKSAPRSEDKNIREVNEDITAFFKSFEEGSTNV